MLLLRSPLAVLQGSGRELASLATALPSAAAEAAEIISSVVKSLPPKPTVLPEGFTVRNGLVERAEEAAPNDPHRSDEQRTALTLEQSDATIALPEHIDGINNSASKNSVEMYQHYDDVRNSFSFLSDVRFNQLSIPAKKLGAIVVRGDPVLENHLRENNASAVTIGNTIAFRKDVCISEVLEETRHYYQNLIGMNNDKEEPLRTILNELDAREFIFRNAARYQVPRNELEFLQRQYESYLEQLKELEKE